MWIIIFIFVLKEKRIGETPADPVFHGTMTVFTLSLCKRIGTH